MRGFNINTKFVTGLVIGGAFLLQMVPAVAIAVEYERVTIFGRALDDDRTGVAPIAGGYATLYNPIPDFYDEQLATRVVGSNGLFSFRNIIRLKAFKVSLVQRRAGLQDRVPTEYSYCTFPKKGKVPTDCHADASWVYGSGPNNLIVPRNYSADVWFNFKKPHFRIVGLVLNNNRFGPNKVSNAQIRTFYQFGANNGYSFLPERTASDGKFEFLNLVPVHDNVTSYFLTIAKSFPDSRGLEYSYCVIPEGSSLRDFPNCHNTWIRLGGVRTGDIPITDGYYADVWFNYYKKPVAVSGFFGDFFANLREAFVRLFWGAPADDTEEGAGTDADVNIDADGAEVIE